MKNPKRVAFVSLGCAKNIVDSEKMLGQLAEAGCVLTADEGDADVVVINTCGFLEASRTEADEVIREAVAAKNARRKGRVVVAGCLAQRDGSAMLDRIAGIDALVGVNNRDDIVRAVLGGRKKKRSTDLFLSEYHPFTQIDTARLRITPRHYAYLRISEGCDQKCTFCTIPSIRGKMHCKPPEVVLAEARELVSDGATEISLIGQDTTSYGLEEPSGVRAQRPGPLGVGRASPPAVGRASPPVGDPDTVGRASLPVLDPGATGASPVTLAGLLRMLAGVDGLRRLRLMYVYPTVLTDDILDAIAEHPKICNYIDIPLQHMNDRVLKAMHRRIDRAGTERLLERIRSRIPGVSIRTTMIAGFPGETDAEFAELVEFVHDFGFDALGVFPYSLEKETPAGRMSGQVPEAVKQERVERLMMVQQERAFALAKERVGSVMEVLVDGYRDDGGQGRPPHSANGRGRGAPPTLIARHEGQAPGVDSVTLVRDCTAAPGEYVTVRCTGTEDYDLLATPANVSLPVLSP